MRPKKILVEANVSSTPYLWAVSQKEKISQETGNTVNPHLAEIKCRQLVPVSRIMMGSETGKNSGCLNRGPLPGMGPCSLACLNLQVALFCCCCCLRPSYNRSAFQFVSSAQVGGSQSPPAMNWVHACREVEQDDVASPLCQSMLVIALSKRIW